jgi:hypothetical protein
MNLSNPQKSETEGEFLIATDGGCLNVNIWCKPNPKKQFTSNKPRFDGSRKFQDDFQSQRGGGFRGGFRGGYRGGNKPGYVKRGGYN